MITENLQSDHGNFHAASTFLRPDVVADEESEESAVNVDLYHSDT